LGPAVKYLYPTNSKWKDSPVFSIASAREFFGALSSPDDFWLAVKQKAIKLKRRSCGFLDGIACGAVVKKIGDGYKLERASVGSPALLDVANSIADNIGIPAEVP
jgi:hypothetical protein